MQKAAGLTAAFIWFSVYSSIW